MSSGFNITLYSVTLTEKTMQWFASVQTLEAYSCSIYSIKSKNSFHSLQQVSTASNLVVRNAICTSVCIWIMGKHVITSPRRLGIHPALVFKLIPQMPSAWHFCEEAGTPSSYRCWTTPPMGQNKPKAEFFSTSSYLLFPVPYLYQRTPPKVSFSLFTDRSEASDD